MTSKTKKPIKESAGVPAPANDAPSGATSVTDAHETTNSELNLRESSHFGAKDGEVSDCSEMSLEDINVHARQKIDVDNDLGAALSHISENMKRLDKLTQGLNDLHAGLCKRRSVSPVAKRPKSSSDISLQDLFIELAEFRRTNRAAVEETSKIKQEMAAVQEKTDAMQAERQALLAEIAFLELLEDMTTSSTSTPYLDSFNLDQSKEVVEHRQMFADELEKRKQADARRRAARERYASLKAKKAEWLKRVETLERASLPLFNHLQVFESTMAAEKPKSLTS